MKWWSEQIDKLDAMITERIAVDYIFRLGMWLQFPVFIITNAIKLLGYPEWASIIFWFSYGISLLCFSVQHRHREWDFQVFFMMTFYNLWDELMGRGAEMQWYEIPIALGLMIITYLKFKKGWSF
jgi:hypothetical protein